jgi:hypothetical protein
MRPRRNYFGRSTSERVWRDTLTFRFAQLRARGVDREPARTVTYKGPIAAIDEAGQNGEIVRKEVIL